MPLLLADFIYTRDCKLNLRKNVDTTSMWGMSCENSQQILLKRAQQFCMLRLTTPHNPKVVGSNPAPATKDPRFCYLGFSLAFLWYTASTLP